MFKYYRTKLNIYLEKNTNKVTFRIHMLTLIIVFLFKPLLPAFTVTILIPYILWLTQAYDKGRYFVKISLSTTAGYFIFKEWCEDIVYKVYIGEDKPKTFLYEFAELIKRLQNILE